MGRSPMSWRIQRRLASRVYSIYIYIYITIPQFFVIARRWLPTELPRLRQAMSRTRLEFSGELHVMPCVSGRDHGAILHAICCLGWVENGRKNVALWRRRSTFSGPKVKSRQMRGGVVESQPVPSDLRRDYRLTNLCSARVAHLFNPRLKDRKF